MTRLPGRVGRWIDDRLGLAKISHHTLFHPIPAATTGRKGWMYVFGAATLIAFVIQVVTGIALATKYIPAPGHAHESLLLINESRLGALLRGMHFWGASAMVLLIFVHMARTFLTGSYKFPRELNWITGGFLLGLTLAMAATGQLLRWDQHGVWTVVVWAQFADRVPLIGEHVARFFLGGDTVGGATLTRFFAFHVFIFPALMFLLVAVHLYLVAYHGISEPPVPGERVERATYRARYAALLERGRPYYPDGTWREAVVAAGVAAIVVVLALVTGPVGPGPVPDPTDVEAVPKPDWFFLWYYTLVWLKPPRFETLVMVYLPLGVGVLLFLMPLLVPYGERSARRRPWAIGAVGATVLVWAVLTGFGFFPYWVPDFETRPISPAALGIPPGPAADGARVFHERGCQYCHAVLGEGGAYGPDLTRVTKRMSPEEATYRIVGGIRDMPAYRDLPTAEVEALIAFLQAAAERRK
jgi:ubiquinol-cytochrome c reductase cytochrome b subunit